MTVIHSIEDTGKKRKESTLASEEENSVKKIKEISTSEHDAKIDQLIYQSCSSSTEQSSSADVPSISSSAPISSVPLNTTDEEQANEQIDSSNSDPSLSTFALQSNGALIPMIPIPTSSTLNPIPTEDDDEDLFNLDVSMFVSKSKSTTTNIPLTLSFEENLKKRRKEIEEHGKDAKRCEEERQLGMKLNREIKDYEANGGKIEEKKEEEKEEIVRSLHDREFIEFKNGFKREFLRFLPCDIGKLDELGVAVDKIEAILVELFLMEDEYDAQQCFEMLQSIVRFRTNNYEISDESSVNSGGLANSETISGRSGSCISCSSSCTCGSSIVSNISESETNPTTIVTHDNKTVPFENIAELSYNYQSNSKFQQENKPDESKSKSTLPEEIQIDIKLNKWRKYCEILFNLGFKKLKSQPVNLQKDKQFLMFACQFALHHLLCSSSVRADNQYENHFWNCDKKIEFNSVYVEPNDNFERLESGSGRGGEKLFGQPENYYQIEIEQISFLFSLIDSEMENELVVSFLQDFKFEEKVSSFSTNWNETASHYFPFFFFKTISSLTYGFNTQIYSVVSKIVLLIIRNSLDLESSITTERILQIQIEMEFTQKKI
ncbi:predicted protein [Naegleria gruberi]|uniref:Predicted protein n=1 Tax=Naegleria gruberi TaxID=5762 RepID=D2W0Q6_NAEGR|nr:uncharacterized protein NAEGRDRAFT_74944 [Naegleria gruberi]EFC37375.1 predicted protein [Naegleria gruberi]|eukprot:XP_002670119.1 predicted protein [Naegleria gruberi strain NEG-M]